MAAVKKEKTKEVTAIGARSMAVKKMLTSILDCIGIDEAKKNYIGTMRIHGRAKDALIANNISRLDMFLTADPEVLLGLPNIGLTSIERAAAEIKDELKDHPRHNTLTEILRYAGSGVTHVEILFRRFGLKTGSVETLAAIGEELQMTRERIRQIERRATIEIKMGRRGKELRDAVRSISDEIAALPEGAVFSSAVTGKLSERQVSKIVSILTKHN